MMPILATGFEADSLNYYRNIGFGGGFVFERDYVHRDPSGFGGNQALYANSSSAGLSFGPLVGDPRWWHGWVWTRSTVFPNGINVSFICNSTTQCTVEVLPSGTVRIRRGSTVGTVVATSVGQVDMSRGHWFAIELNAEPVATGFCNVYVDDEVTPIVSFTGDLQQGSQAGWNCFVYSDVAGAEAFLDDLIITDAVEGRYNETFAKRLIPIADVVSGLTPSTGADNYKNIRTYDTSTYNSTTSATTEDRYSFSNRSKFGSIDFVSVGGVVAAQNDFEMQVATRSNVTSDYGSLRSGTSSYRDIPPEYYLNDPDTAAPWTEDAVNALESGVRSGT